MVLASLQDAGAYVCVTGGRVKSTRHTGYCLAILRIVGTGNSEMVGKKAGGLAILRIAGTWEIILRIDGNGGDLSCGPVAQMFNPKD